MKLISKRLRRDRLTSQMQRAARDVDANVTILFAMSAIVLVLLVGMGLDYYVGLSDKTRLDAAADAAALAAANTAKAFYAANSGTMSETDLETAAKAAGKAQGLTAFAANVGSTATTTTVTPTITVSYDGQLNFTAQVQFNTAAATHFGSIVNIASLQISGSSTAVAQLPKYIDFYIISDVSGSMGIPTSTDDQKTLIKNNPDNAIEKSQYPSGCQFACHFSGYSGFTYTQQLVNGQPRIPLKLNSLSAAIQGLITTATNTETNGGIANQFRIGIYPYIVHAFPAAPLSSDLSSTGVVASVAGNLANYEDNGTTYNASGTTPGELMGSGGTHLENVWNDLHTTYNVFKSAGTGFNSSSTLPFMILVTDGIDNTQTYAPFNGSGPNLPDTTSSSSICAKAKAMGYTVAVLLIPYVPIYDPVMIWNDEDAAVNYLIDPTTYAAPPEPYTPTLQVGQTYQSNMQACASPGYFFSAGTSSDINNAMQKIFYQAVAQSRLTQ